MYRIYTFVYILQCIELYTNVSLQECIEILKCFLNNEGVKEREEVGGQSEGKSAVPGPAVYNPEQSLVQEAREQIP